SSFLRCPGILERGRAVDDRFFRRRVYAICNEIAQTLELPGGIGGVERTRFQPAVDDMSGVRIERIQKVFVARVGVWVAEQTVVQADFSGDGVCDADPGDISLDLDRVGTRRPAFGIGQVFG